VLSLLLALTTLNSLVALGAELRDEKVTVEMQEALKSPSEEQLALYMRLARNKDATTRIRAIRAMEECDVSEMMAEVTTILIACTTDPEANVRNRALECMAYHEIKTPEAVSAITRLLDDPQDSIQTNAMQLLVGMVNDPKTLMPTLLQKVDKGSPKVADAAMELVQHMGPPPEAIPVLKRAYEKHGENALYAIAMVVPVQPELLPWLRKIMSDPPSHEHRLAAAWALGRQGDAETLIQAARSEQVGVRAAGMHALAALRQPNDEATRLMVAGLKDPSEPVRVSTAENFAFAPAPSEDLLVALMRSCGDPSPDVRRCSRTSLEKFTDEQVAPLDALKIVDKALQQTPDDVGLVLAKSEIAFPLAHGLIYDDLEQSWSLFKPASEAMIRVVLKSDFKPTGSEREQIGTLFYDTACVACKLGKTDQGLTYLRAALENGWRDIAHLKEDRDLEPLRTTNEYQEMMNKYGR